jgi:hypothetical protein
MRDCTSFPELPGPYHDVHLGKLLFATAKAQFHSLELREFRQEKEEEKEIRLRQRVGLIFFNFL